MALGANLRFVSNNTGYKPFPFCVCEKFVDGTHMILSPCSMVFVGLNFLLRVCFLLAVFVMKTLFI